MTISTAREPHYSIISVSGDIDASSAIDLDEEIEKAITNGEKNIGIDCTGLEYISSAGLGVFMSYIENTKQNGITLTLFGLNPKVHKVFELVGLDKLIKISPNKELALGLFV